MLSKSLMFVIALLLVAAAPASAHSYYVRPAFTCWLTGETITGSVLQTVAGTGATLEEATAQAFASCRYFFLKNCQIDRCIKN